MLEVPVVQKHRCQLPTSHGLRFGCRLLVNSHAKAHIVAIYNFTRKNTEHIQATAHNLGAPVVKKTHTSSCPRTRARTWTTCKHYRAKAHIVATDSCTRKKMRHLQVICKENDYDVLTADYASAEARPWAESSDA